MFVKVFCDYKLYEDLSFCIYDTPLVARTRIINQNQKLSSIPHTHKYYIVTCQANGLFAFQAARGKSICNNIEIPRHVTSSLEIKMHFHIICTHWTLKKVLLTRLTSFIAQLQPIVTLIFVFFPIFFYSLELWMS